MRRYEQPINSLDELCKVVRVLLGILSSLLKVQYQLAPLLQPLHRRFTAAAWRATYNVQHATLQRCDR